MKKLLFPILITLTFAAAAQDAEPAKKAENSNQRTTRQVSIRDLREADEKLNKEREVLTKSERRIAQLLEQLENNSQALTARETSLKELLAQSRQGDGNEDFRVPQVQIDYWDKRNPITAAKDFAPLYLARTDVAVDIIKRMKKKTAARLIDEVSKLEEDGINGTEIAARLNEAVGISEVEKQ